MRIHLSSFLLLFTLLPQITQSNIVIACRCSDGIIIGCDSLSVSGSLVGNRVAETVYLLGTNTVLCCATGHSDFHRLLSDLKSYIRTADVSSRGTIKTSSIARYARRLVSQKYRSAHLIIAGSDGNKNNRVRIKNGIYSGSEKKSTVITPNGEIPGERENKEIDIDQNGIEQEESISRIRTKTEHEKEHEREHDMEHETEHETEEYSVHEILSGGTLITQSFALAGSGSDCVITLMDELFSHPHSDSHTLSQSQTQTQMHTQTEKTKDIELKSKSDTNSVSHHAVDIFSTINNNRNKVQGMDSGPSLPTIQESIKRVRKVLRASAQTDPKSGSYLRVWGLDRDGLSPL